MTSLVKNTSIAMMYMLVLTASNVNYAGEKKDIVDTAVEAGSFNTLAAALKAADLVDALRSDGKFTVFAPTDAAFAKLPKGTVETLLKPENKGKLVSILKYHVVPGAIPAKKVVILDAVKTLAGQSVTIDASNGTVTINQAKVVKADIKCSNGIVHVIDRVLLPPEKKKISAAESRSMIEHAVSRGVKLYNDGHHSACAKIYASTARKMVEYDSPMPSHLVHHLKTVLSVAEKTECPTARAWKLRHGLDRVYHAMMETYSN